MFLTIVVACRNFLIRGCDQGWFGGWIVADFNDVTGWEEEIITFRASGAPFATFYEPVHDENRTLYPKVPLEEALHYGDFLLSVPEFIKSIKIIRQFHENKKSENPALEAYEIDKMADFPN